MHDDALGKVLGIESDEIKKYGSNSKISRTKNAKKKIIFRSEENREE
jgi:hypothetical protein